MKNDMHHGKEPDNTAKQSIENIQRQLDSLQINTTKKKKNIRLML